MPAPASLEALLPAIVARRDAPGIACALFEGTTITWSGAAGIRRLPNVSPRPLELTVDTKARVASVSKIATALTLILEAQDGRIDLDADASQALGFQLRHPRFPDSPITPRMTLSHTAGIRDADAYRGVIGETLEGFFHPGGVRWNTGRHWAGPLAGDGSPLGWFAYANLGMGLVAQMAERLSGERFDLLARRRIFDPLGIDCGFNWSGVPDAKVESGATLYRHSNDGPWTVQVDEAPHLLPRPIVAASAGLDVDDYVIGQNGLVFAPQGGLRASVNDLVGIGMALTGARPLLSDRTRAMIAEPVWRRAADSSNGDTSGGSFRAFGTGVHIVLPDADGPVPGLQRPLIGHYGDAYGLLAGLWVDQASTKGFAWFLTGSPSAPRPGASGIHAVEEEVMQAACHQLGLVG